MSGLTSAGYTPIRSAEYLTLLRAAIATELVAAGITAEIDWAADTILGTITSVTAASLGRLGEVAQAVYDARSPNNATGAQLDDLCTIVGVSRLDATYSTAAVTLTGTSGTIIPAGSVVSGGGTDGLARWTLAASVTLASGTGTGAVTAEDVGAIAAAIGEIDAIITSSPGGRPSPTPPLRSPAGTSRRTRPSAFVDSRPSGWRALGAPRRCAPG